MTQRIATTLDGLRRHHTAALTAFGASLALALLAPVFAEVIRTALAQPTARGLPLGASAVAGMATGLGAIGVFALRRPSGRGLTLFMALAGGMMLAAALFSLLAPAVAWSVRPWAIDAALAAAAGYAAMALIDRLLPHSHPTPQAARAAPGALRLMAVAIAAHNLPEGLAVAAGFGGGDALGWSTALAIGAQNVPEGLIVAAALWTYGAPRRAAAAWAAVTGMIEPLGALAGAAAAVQTALAPALALAGGAMLFVVFDELLPEVWRAHSAPHAALGFAVGFCGLAALIAPIA